ncbi:MAG: prolyl-tRNA synthetase associated domain-containing protein, partial [Gemmatimonadetes bacterium]|nr:prolyl-tRNA synthetase associated domain-containing protein [Gemmatimonadota bacterium]
VELVFDRAVWAADAIQCHPLLNTSTLVLARADVERFLQCTGHEWQVGEVPTRG